MELSIELHFRFLFQGWKVIGEIIPLGSVGFTPIVACIVSVELAAYLRFGLIGSGSGF